MHWGAAAQSSSLMLKRTRACGDARSFRLRSSSPARLIPAELAGRLRAPGSPGHASFQGCSFQVTWLGYAWGTAVVVGLSCDCGTPAPGDAPWPPGTCFRVVGPCSPGGGITGSSGPPCALPLPGPGWASPVGTLPPSWVRARAVALPVYSSRWTAFVVAGGSRPPDSSARCAAKGGKACFLSPARCAPEFPSGAAAIGVLPGPALVSSRVRGFVSGGASVLFRLCSGQHPRRGELR